MNMLTYNLVSGEHSQDHWFSGCNAKIIYSYGIDKLLFQLLLCYCQAGFLL